MPSILSFVVAFSLLGAEPAAPQTYQAQDTLNVAPDPNPQTQACLDGFSWKPGKFTVVCSGPEHAVLPKLVRFPSPRPTGNATNDLVALEWFPVRNDQGHVIRAPAMVVVHESGANMAVGKLFARSLRAYGIHAFLIHLPYYGERKTGKINWESVDFPLTVRQAIADVRRARDAVAALPQVEATRIGLQGTSLGGFVAALSGGLDGRYSAVFVMLAGGDLEDLIRNGQQDTAKLRESLTKAGYTGEKLHQAISGIEPTHVAHRLDPRRTWMYSATQDRVVPFKNCQILAQAAKLDDSHHIRVGADHYSAIFHFPKIVQHVAEQLKALP